MTFQIPGVLNSPYGYGLGALFILLLLLLPLRGKRPGFERVWKPLIPVVRGKVKNGRSESTMTGDYRGRPVTASLRRGEADQPLAFSLQMPVGSSGRDWEVSRRSEQLLGPEAWRPYTQDPALQARLESVNVAGMLRNWPNDTVVRYDARQGILTLCQQAFNQSAGNFKATLNLLESLAEVNRQVNE